MFRTDEELRDDGLNPKDIRFFRSEEKRFDVLSVKLNMAREVKDWGTVLDLEDDFNTVNFYLKYYGKHPKEIPVADMRLMVDGTVDTDPSIKPYREKIRNAGTAQRAFCVICMGGQIAEVRRCTAVQCPMWPFRMGQNPFHGKTLPAPVDSVELPDDENIQIEDDASEGTDNADS